MGKREIRETKEARELTVTSSLSRLRAELLYHQSTTSGSRSSTPFSRPLNLEIRENQDLRDLRELLVRRENQETTEHPEPLESLVHLEKTVPPEPKVLLEMMEPKELRVLRVIPVHLETMETRETRVRREKPDKRDWLESTVLRETRDLMETVSPMTTLLATVTLTSSSSTLS